VRLCRPVAVRVLAPIAIAIAVAAAVFATASPGWPAGPPAALPAGISPLPADVESHLHELLAAAETIRGLKAKRPILAGVVEEKDLPARVAESLRGELPAERLHAAEVGLKAFGLLPEALDLARYLPMLLASQVAGYYDPERRYLTLVHHAGGALGLKAEGEPAEAKATEEMVLVHELTHALQDQAFDLRQFIEDDPLSDEATARTALVEGDASLVMFDYYTGHALESIPEAGKAVASALKSDPGGADLPGAKEMAAAPAWLRDSLEFGYVDGYLFCLDVRRKGGQKLLDSAFTTDPPRSSEQILHPEKWHTRRDDPILLPWPDLIAALPGGRKLAEGQLGELGIFTLLREAAKGRPRSPGFPKPSVAAAGWGGDRFAVYETDGRRLLAWLTEWDTENDAQELRAAARSLGREWDVKQVAPRRVVLFRGDWSWREKRAVRKALAAVKAGRAPVERLLPKAQSR